MKVAIDVRSLMEGRHSGVEEYTTQIIRALMREAPEHEYHLFYNSWRSVTLPDFGQRASIHAFRYPNKLFNLFQWLFRWPRWDRLVPGDVFFLPNVRLLPLTSGVPYVVTAHDLSFEHFPEFYSWRRRMWHKLMRPRQIMRQAAGVVAVSEATKADVVNLYGIAESSVQVIYSGVDVKASKPRLRADMLHLERGALSEKFVLYLGTHEPRKNIPSIIEAYTAIAAQVPHDLVLAGSSGWLTYEIDRAHRASSVRHRIHRLGFVTEQEKWTLYQAASLFVYPSFYEGFGFPPLESLLCGTPVITSHNSALPEVVGEWAWLINPYDVGELAMVMRECLTKGLSVPDGVDRVIEERFSWGLAARKLERLLVLAGGS